MKRFWEKVRTSDSCWEWCAAVNKQGYGRFMLNGRNSHAHRVAYELCVGTIPEGMCVCHHCDNPSCVNPDHLFIGTISDNNNDKAQKGRCRNGSATMFGSDHPRAKLSEADLIEILKSNLGNRKLANQYGVNESLIRQIKVRKIWRHVEVEN